ncbi:hypothetical protein ACHAQJ_005239 [Trichoderma viride]
MRDSKRKRSIKACRPCRDRKRKCGGEHPCVTCTEWGYECYYEASAPKRRAARTASLGTRQQMSEEARTSPSRPEKRQIDQDLPDQDHGGLVRRIEANSSAAFVRKLALKIDPTKAPKLSLFAWNIGSRQYLSSVITSSSMLQIHEIASLEHFEALAHVYFDKVDPTYGFIDRHGFFQRLTARWHSPVISSEPFDSVITGVAAIGCLFSQRTVSITESHLAQASRAILDSHRLTGAPSLDILTGWALRLVYLRMTGSPHETWLASSTLMHLLEAAGLHPETHSVLYQDSHSLLQSDIDIKRSLVGVAQHLNTWISFDLGLTRISFKEDDVPPRPRPKPGNCTTEILELLPLAIGLDPAMGKDEVDLLSTLSELLRRTHDSAGFLMAQCNIVLCVLRRMYTQNLGIPPRLLEPVLSLFKSALTCAPQLVADCAPWHQVANVPFQIVYMLLVIDNRASLTLLPEALHTLQCVASEYNTDTMREAYSAAGLLLWLHQQRRRDDLLTLDKALSTYQQGAHLEMTPPSVQGPEDLSWLGALVADMPGLQGLDLDQLLRGDMGGMGFSTSSYNG